MKRRDEVRRRREMWRQGEEMNMKEEGRSEEREGRKGRKGRKGRERGGEGGSRRE
jgi:hypothetical protein